MQKQFASIKTEYIKSQFRTGQFNSQLVLLMKSLTLYGLDRKLNLKKVSRAAIKLKRDSI